MRVQSIISAFIIVLGNGILHLTLLILSTAVEVPKQEEMD